MGRLGLAVLTLLVGLSAADAQFYNLGRGVIPTDVSADGTVAVGIVEGTGTFVNTLGYFDWVRDAVPSNPDPASWLLAINGGVDIGGGPAGGTPRISDDGRYVGGTALNPVSGYAEMSRLDRDTVVINPDGSTITNWVHLGGPAGSREIDDDFSSGHGMSGDGNHLVGSSWRTEGGTSAFQWTQGAPELIDLPRAFPRSARANAVSDDGSVVVGWQDASSAVARNAMIWVDGEPYKRLNRSGEASAVSADGNWVVGIDHAYGLPGDYDNSGLVDAADYTVWRDNVGNPAVGLRNDVDSGVVGEAQYNTWRENYGAVLTERTRDAWRWSEATGLEPLGRLAPGVQRGYASDVNQDGTLILGFDRDFGVRIGLGWVWQEGVGITDLKQYFIAQGISSTDLGGFSFGLPLAISADERTFVGLGFDPSTGREAGWVVTLPPLSAAGATPAPEPTAAMLLLCGAAVAAAARGRVS